MAQINLNLSGFNPYGDTYELLPPGEYPVRITQGDLKHAKNGSGQYLNLRYDVIDGPSKGRILFDTLSLWSQNATAREIAARRLKSIGMAIKVANPDFISDTDELLDGEMIVRVAIRKDDTGQYGDKNECKAYKPLAGVAVGSSPMAGAMPTPPPAAPAGQTKQQTPWG